MHKKRGYKELGGISRECCQYNTNGTFIICYYDIHTIENIVFPEKAVRDEILLWEEEVETTLNQFVSINIPIDTTIRWHARLYRLQSLVSVDSKYHHMEGWARDVLIRRRVLWTECRVSFLGCLVRMRIPPEIRCILVTLYGYQEKEYMKETARYLTCLLSALRSGDWEPKKIKL